MHGMDGGVSDHDLDDEPPNSHTSSAEYNRPIHTLQESNFADVLDAVFRQYASIEHKREELIGLSQKDFDSLRSVVFRVKAWRKERLDCPICIDPFLEGQRLKCLPCNTNHIFHITCVKQWLLKHRSCPLCRSDIHKLVSPTKQQEKHRAPILRTHSSTSMFHNPFRMNSGSSTHLPAVDQSSHRPPWDSTGQDGLGAHAHSDT